jgi:hypothetical protein
MNCWHRVEIITVEPSWESPGFFAQNAFFAKALPERRDPKKAFKGKDRERLTYELLDG